MSGKKLKNQKNGKKRRKWKMMKKEEEKTMHLLCVSSNLQSLTCTWQGGERNYHADKRNKNTRTQE
jgi:hypothetical protein